jgi:endonuclease G
VAAATGFLVGPDVLLTFPIPWQTPRKTNRKPGVFVDFARTVANEPPRRFRAVEELYRDDELLLLRLETPTAKPLPSPLPLRRERPDGATLPGERVFLVGHPAAVGAALGDPAVSRMFPPPFGVKRVALGMLRDVQADEPRLPGTNLRHDCSTTVGDGGAPLVSLATGEALGMHLGGAFGRGNFGVSIWSMLEKPEARAILG